MTALAQLGGLAGLAALLTAIGGVLTQVRQTRKLREDTAQLQPDHGTSVADRVHAMDEKLDLVIQGQKQTADSADQVHELISSRLRMHDIELRDIKRKLE